MITINLWLFVSLLWHKRLAQFLNMRPGGTNENEYEPTE